MNQGICRYVYAYKILFAYFIFFILILLRNQKMSSLLGVSFQLFALTVYDLIVIYS